MTYRCDHRPLSIIPAINQIGILPSRLKDAFSSLIHQTKHSEVKQFSTNEIRMSPLHSTFIFLLYMYAMYI